MRRQSLVVVIAALMIGGCAGKITSENVAKFSAALTASSDSIKSSFAVVNDIAGQTAQRQNALKYALCHVPKADARRQKDLCDEDGDGQLDRLTNVTPPPAALSPEVLAPRLELLAALAEYAAALKTLVDEDQGARVEAAFNGAGEALIDLANASGADTPAALGPLGQAVGRLGRHIVNIEVQQSLGTAVETTHPFLNDAVAALRADLVTLRRRAVLEVRAGNRVPSAILDDDSLRLVSAPERFGAYRDLGALATPRATVEGLFNTADRLLDRLLKAHQALADPESPDAITQVTSFLNDAADFADIVREIEEAD